MLQTNEKIIRHKVGLLNLAEELGNVSRACKLMARFAPATRYANVLGGKVHIIS